MTHPFRDHQIIVYEKVTGDKMPAFIAFIDGSPHVRFGAETRKAAYDRAETFRCEAIEKHEARLIARKEAAAKREEQAK